MRLLLVVVAAGALVLAPGALGRDRVDRLPQSTLEHQAELVVTTGGVICRRHGCATPYMRRLVRELIERAFPVSARSWALCVSRRESGYNPGAISPTSDYGVAQIHLASHPWVNGQRLLVDPVYAVAVFVHLSRHGTERSPWYGGSYRC